MPTGIILAYSIPDGAEVLIDNIPAFTRFGTARTPALIPEVSASTHNVTFRLYGYIEKTMSIQIQQGGYSSVTAILEPKSRV
jgi:hypothetical protein